jgi:hypothetical protein
MHPIVWLRKDLPTALVENIGRALHEVGIVYGYQIKGRGFGVHSSSLHTMIYRLACESVAYIYAHMRCSNIHLTLRGAEIDGNHLLILRVEGGLRSTSEDRAYFDEGQRDRLAEKLGATRLDLTELRDHVRLFNGTLHVRIKGDKLRLTFLLQDVSETERKGLSTLVPLRLWAN